MDPSVAAVEALLDERAQRVVLTGRVRADRALYVCACAGEEDAPNWLLYDDARGTVCWTRVDDGIDLPDLVDARHAAGLHAAPEDVVSWLRGTWPEHADFGWGEPDAARALIQRPARR